MPLEQMTNANKPASIDGTTYHVETRKGQVSNRILTVGDPQRARKMAAYFDKILFEHSSHRGFLTITGIYKNLPISIVAIGMGLSMMDFFVRETRMVVDGPMCIIRFGSCGSICNANVGDFILAKRAFGITRNFDYFMESSDTTINQNPYLLWKPVDADPELTRNIRLQLMNAVGDKHIFEGAVGNADSFYSSQGRLGDDFYDANDSLIQRIHHEYPDASALEMESHMLFHLAKVSTGSDNTRKQSIRAACALVVFADRTGNAFISPDMSKLRIETAAKCLFDALIQEMPTQEGLHPAKGSVWEHEI